MSEREWTLWPEYEIAVTANGMPVRDGCFDSAADRWIKVVPSSAYRGAVEALREIAGFEVDSDDGYEYSLGAMRALAANALDGLREQ